MNRLPLFPHPHQDPLFAFSTIANLPTVRWNRSAILVCVSLLAKDVEHFLVCLLLIHTSVESCLFSSFVHLLTACLVCGFFWLLCRFHSSSLGSRSPRQSCVGLFGNVLWCRPKRLAREQATFFSFLGTLLHPSGLWDPKPPLYSDAAGRPPPSWIWCLSFLVVCAYKVHHCQLMFQTEPRVSGCAVQGGEW